MRALTALTRSLLSAFALATIVLALLTAAAFPVEQARATSLQAHADEVARPQSVDVPDTPANPAGSLIFVALALAGVGIVVNLSAKVADGTVKRFSLDSEKEGDFNGQLIQAIEAKVEEATQPLTQRLSKAVEKARGYRDLLVGEIVRRLELSADKPADFDAKEETAYYNTLRLKDLKTHFLRVLDLPLKTEATTKPGAEGVTGPVATPSTAGDEGFGTVQVK